MQRAEEPDKVGGGLSPLHAFIVVLTIITAISTVVALTRPNETPTTAPVTTETPPFTLTNTEAIERFRHLDALRLRAYSTRDSSLLGEVFTPTSPIRGKVSREIEVLLSSDVLSHTRFETTNLRKAQASTDRIVIYQQVIVRPAFVSESGDEVTEEGRVEIQTIRWTMKRIVDEWFLHDAVIVAAKPLRGEP